MGAPQTTTTAARDLHSLLGKLIRTDPLPSGGKSYAESP
jgi:hypothetical protein